MIENQTNRPLVLVVAQGRQGSAGRCAQLTLAGYRAIDVCDRMEALELIRRERPSLVLLLAGEADSVTLDFANVLHEVSALSYLPLLVQVRWLRPEAACGYFRKGVDGVITDATSPDEFVARVASLLRVKELHDQLSASRLELQKALGRERRLMAKLRRDNADLQEQCTTDALTRVQNVRSFRQILDHEFKTAVRYNQPVSVLMLDVDHFKLVNDTFGHPAGDYVLKELAVILKRSIRESDVVARTGGEEFSIILPRADLRRCAVLADRIRRAVAAHRFDAYGRHIRITISIGSATYPMDAEITEPAMLVYLADQALLLAKETGRDRVVALHALEMPIRSRLWRQYRQEEVESGERGVGRREKREERGEGLARP